MHTFRQRARRALIGLLAGAAVMATSSAVQPVSMADPARPAMPLPPCVLDVAFAIDDTGSMGGAINNIKTEINDIITAVQAMSGTNHQLALLTFKDNVTVVHDLALNNSAAVTASVNLLAAGGGGNTPEASDEALNTAINGLDGGVLRPQQTGNFDGVWRSNASKMLVLVTDAVPGGFDDAHGPGDVLNASNRADEAALQGIEISPIYVETNPGATPQINPIMTDYANTTGGTFVTTPGNGAGAADAIEAIIRECQRQTDVYIRDFPLDNGTEPHSQSVYQSPDIKVCPTSTECAAPGQNPIVGQPNWVFVTLNNPGPYGTGPGTGIVKLYRSTPGGGTMWQSQWTHIGDSAVVTVPPFSTLTVPIYWPNPPGPGHFCLLARWISGSDPMTSAEGTNTVLNTQRNNNIAWRNVDSVRLPAGTGTTRPYAIGNPLRIETRNDLVITPTDGFMAGGGRLQVDLGEDLFRRWVAGGQVGVGVRPVGGTRLEVFDPRQARIGNIALRPGERPTLTLIFLAAATARPGEHNVLVHQEAPAEEDSERPIDVGGVMYNVTITQR